MEEVISGTRNVLALGAHVQTVPADTHTDGRGPPFTEGQFRSRGDPAKTFALFPDSVDTASEGDEGVVESPVGLVSATDNLTVLITVGILLCIRADREEEACCSKNSKDSFDTFHNL